MNIHTQAVAETQWLLFEVHNNQILENKSQAPGIIAILLCPQSMLQMPDFEAWENFPYIRNETKKSKLTSKILDSSNPFPMACEEMMKLRWNLHFQIEVEMVEARWMEEHKKSEEGDGGGIVFI